MNTPHTEKYVNAVVGKFFSDPENVSTELMPEAIIAFVSKAVTEVVVAADSLTTDQLACLSKAAIERIYLIANRIAHASKSTLRTKGPHEDFPWSRYRGNSFCISARAHNAIAKVSLTELPVDLRAIVQNWPKDADGYWNPSLMQLSKLTVSQLLRFPRMGVASVNEVRKLLFDREMCLKGDDPRLMLQSGKN